MNKIELMEIFLAQRGLCFYCLRPMSLSRNNGAVSYTKDHFIPKIKGGKTNGNIVLAHKVCNNRKGRRYPTVDERVRFSELYRRIAERREEIENIRGEYGRKRTEGNK